MQFEEIRIGTTAESRPTDSEEWMLARDLLNIYGNPTTIGFMDYDSRIPLNTIGTDLEEALNNLPRQYHKGVKHRLLLVIWAGEKVPENLPDFSLLQFMPSHGDMNTNPDVAQSMDGSINQRRFLKLKRIIFALLIGAGFLSMAKDAGLIKKSALDIFSGGPASGPSTDNNEQVSSPEPTSIPTQLHQATATATPPPPPPTIEPIPTTRPDNHPYEKVYANSDGLDINLNIAVNGDVEPTILDGKIYIPSLEVGKKAVVAILSPVTGTLVFNIHSLGLYGNDTVETNVLNRSSSATIGGYNNHKLELYRDFEVLVVKGEVVRLTISKNQGTSLRGDAEITFESITFTSSQ